MTAVLAPAFSQEIREATVNAHGSAQRSGFMAALFAGDVDRDRYAQFAAQQWFIYRALEDAAVGLAEDPIARRFLYPELTRVPAIEADLAFLHGPGWPRLLRATPDTLAYVAAIERASTWSGGLVAHHYVRYMGDLSGGQHIAKVIAGKLGLEQDGVRAFAFAIPDLDAFKANYRQALDEAPWTAVERAAVLTEILGAYAFATDMLAGL